MSSARRVLLENLASWVDEIANLQIFTDVKSFEISKGTGDKAFIWNGDDLDGRVIATSSGHVRRFQTFIRVFAGKSATAIELRNEDLAELVIAKILEKIAIGYALTPQIIIDDVRISEPDADRERNLGQLTISLEYHTP